jgi:hypothetical protein
VHPAVIDTVMGREGVTGFANATGTGENEARAASTTSIPSAKWA